MRLVAGADVREYVNEHGGAVYVWAETRGCCRGRTHVLECAIYRPDREFELVHAAGGFQVFGTAGLRQPDELHLELDRRRQLRAYWNGQGWIG